jgi:sugar/nucleoside kinase (ribokinase family)
VVGSVAFDSVRTPHGQAEEALGGAATYFSVAASILHRPIHLVGVVGTDFPAEVVTMLEERGIDCAGLIRTEGKTFRWKGYYEGDMNAAVTEETHLNVFGSFKPALPPALQSPSYLFLANIDPVIQLDVLRQISRPRTVAADTMNFWISSKLDALKALIAEIDLLVLNEGEVVQLTGLSNLVAAAHEVLRMGPRVVVVKKGAHGSMLVTANEIAIIPPVPLEAVVDPTGAGDSFGGGLMAALARMDTDHTDFEGLRKAAAYGSVIASFNCESFSMERLKQLKVREVEERLERLRGCARF